MCGGGGERARSAQPRYAWVALVVIICSTVPVDLYAFSDKLVDDMTLNLPRGTESTDAYIAMGNTFGFGTMYPYRILLTPNATTAVGSQAFFDIVCDMIGSLVAGVPRLQPRDFSSIMYLNGACSTYAFIEVRDLYVDLL